MLELYARAFDTVRFDSTFTRAPHPRRRVAQTHAAPFPFALKLTGDHARVRAPARERGTFAEFWTTRGCCKTSSRPRSSLPPHFGRADPCARSRASCPAADRFALRVDFRQRAGCAGRDRAADTHTPRSPPARASGWGAARIGTWSKLAADFRLRPLHGGATSRFDVGNAARSKPRPGRSRPRLSGSFQHRLVYSHFYDGRPRFPPTPHDIGQHRPSRDLKTAVPFHHGGRVVTASYATARVYEAHRGDTAAAAIHGELPAAYGTAHADGL